MRLVGARFRLDDAPKRSEREVEARRRACRTVKEDFRKAVNDCYDIAGNFLEGDFCPTLQNQGAIIAAICDTEDVEYKDRKRKGR